MSLRHLSGLFRPTSIAVIGASNREGSVGQVVMRNLLDGRFSGPVMPLNPHAHAVAGVLAYASIAALPETPDLAVICAPAAAIPDLVDQLGRRGTRAAVVISGGLRRVAEDAGETWEARMLAAARPHGLRILGGTSLGLLIPKLGLNASVAPVRALPGRLAFVSQSGAVSAGVLDWALTRGIGFSHFVALGDAADVGFDDLLDYLAADSGTAAILLYLETITERRDFMAAARAAARNKQVLAVKAGLNGGEDRCAPSLVAHIATPDAVFDGALRRAGILRVTSIDELFAAVETLARARPVRGDGVAVLATGGGTATLATDELVRGGGRLARLAPETQARLGTNPVDLGADAAGRRYAEALKLLDRDKGVDAVLVMHAPNALTSSTDAARAVIEATRQISCSVFTCWIGGQAVTEARHAFAAAGMATYDTPRDAVGAFLHMVEHRRVLDMLMETPPTTAADLAHRSDAARDLVREALAEGRTVLTGPEAKALLATYGLCGDSAATPRHGRPLLVGVVGDALFGPVVVFGEGGRAVEMGRDHAVGLPPLNMPLARELVLRSGVDRGSRVTDAACWHAVCRALCRVSQMVVDLPELAELEINPLLADESGVTVLAARVVLAPVVPGSAERRLAIRPYPQELEEWACLRDGSRALIRPIRPEDEQAHRDLKDSMSAEDLRMRFFGSTGPATHAELARYTQIDYEREMAFIAAVDGPDGQVRELGAVRLICDPDLQCGEFGINVRSDSKRLGLGRVLMDKVIRYAAGRGLARISGRVLAENTVMLGLCRRLGFTVELGEGEDVAEVVLRLAP